MGGIVRGDVVESTDVMVPSVEPKPSAAEEAAKEAAKKAEAAKEAAKKP